MERQIFVEVQFLWHIFSFVAEKKPRLCLIIIKTNYKKLYQKIEMIALEKPSNFDCVKDMSERILI